ncbi:hypothetical protein GQX74_001804 [Glossina fuscipes]|nr:hypothetical protein GQX74_001804 [Glossina fuscipes]
MGLRRKKLYIYFLIVFGSIFYCEFLADYITLWKCEWPPLPQDKDVPSLRAMILADVHLLGPVNGHWLDKLYREWHMRRAFQASLTIHYPDVVFILGDLFDEDKLDCLRNVHTCSDMETIQNHHYYSRPIIMQHFPTYRISDKSCTEHDSLEIEEYREKWEVLSRNSTDWLGELLQPRLSFAGHSHHYCHSINRWGVDEYTLASFNWRNKINPSFLMATLTSENHWVSKCNMLKQETVVNVYLCAIFLLTVGLVRDTHRWFLQKIKLL